MSSKPNASHATADLSISGSSVARSIARLSRSAVNISPPGFAELGGIAKALVENWKTTNCNGNDLADLAARVEGLCNLIHDINVIERSDVTESSRRLYEIKNSLNEEIKRQPRSRVLGAEQQQRLLDSLSCEVDRIVEALLLRSMLMQVQSDKHDPMKNFQVISTHEITDMHQRTLGAGAVELPHISGGGGVSVPPFTIKPGDIGYTAKRSQGTIWTPTCELEQMGIDGDTTRYFSDCECDPIPYYGRSRAEGSQWISTSLPVCDCVDKHFQWTARRHTEISNECARQGRASLCDRGMEVEGAQFCTSVHFVIYYRQIGPVGLPEPLYLHRNPFIHTDPRAFWGFLSTSADPRSPGIDQAEAGLELTYRVYYETICFADFWDYKYEKMLRSGLASIPGGYSKSYIEEVERDETG